METMNADPIVRLMRAILALGRRMRSERPPESLSLSSLGLLGALHRSGPTVATRLAAQECLQPQSLTRILGELEQRRLIVRKPSREDRRAITIAITAAGRRVLREDIAARRDWLAAAMHESLAPEERDLLLSASAVMLKLASHPSSIRSNHDERTTQLPRDPSG